jgi:hypothetical protein
MEDLQRRFGVGRIALVADRGLISEDNLAEVEAHGFDHVLATRLHRDEDVAAVLEAANSSTTSWVPVPEARSYVTEVAHDHRRFVVVFSPVRYLRDRARHAMLCARVEDGLMALERRVNAKHLADPAKIGAAADRILRDSGVARCFVIRWQKPSSPGTSTRRHGVTTRSCSAAGTSSPPRSMLERPTVPRCFATTAACRTWREDSGF